MTRRESDKIRLQIAEAIIILSDDPLINRQDTGKTRPNLDNDPQIIPHPFPSKRADDKSFVAYVSDDFKTKKIFKGKTNLEKNVRIFFEKPGKVHFWYAVDTNLFRLGSSIQECGV